MTKLQLVLKAEYFDGRARRSRSSRSGPLLETQQAQEDGPAPTVHVLSRGSTMTTDVQLRQALSNLLVTYVACNGEDHPAYLEAEVALNGKKTRRGGSGTSFIRDEARGSGGGDCRWPASASKTRCAEVRSGTRARFINVWVVRCNGRRRDQYSGSDPLRTYPGKRE
jgi:hypothetical protein